MAVQDLMKTMQPTEQSVGLSPMGAFARALAVTPDGSYANVVVSSMSSDPLPRAFYRA